MKDGSYEQTILSFADGIAYELAQKTDAIGYLLKNYNSDYIDDGDSASINNLGLLLGDFAHQTRRLAVLLNTCEFVDVKTKLKFDRREKDALGFAQREADRLHSEYCVAKRTAVPSVKSES